MPEDTKTCQALPAGFGKPKERHKHTKAQDKKRHLCSRAETGPCSSCGRSKDGLLVGVEGFPNIFFFCHGSQVNKEKLWGLIGLLAQVSLL